MTQVSGACRWLNGHQPLAADRLLDWPLVIRAASLGIVRLGLCAAVVGLAVAGCGSGSDPTAATDADANEACLRALAARAPLAPKDELGQYAIARLQVSTTASGWSVTGRTAPRPAFPAREFACQVTSTGGRVVSVTVTRDRSE